MDAFAEYRDAVKKQADGGKIPLLKLSDELRDVKLPELGIELKDTEGDKATWNFKDPEEIKKEREQKKKLKTGNLSQKELAAKKKSTPPSEFFKEFNDKEYTQFDADGIPTHWIKEEKNKKSPDFGKKLEKEIVK